MCRSRWGLYKRTLRSERLLGLHKSHTLPAMLLAWCIWVLQMLWRVA